MIHVSLEPIGYIIRVHPETGEMPLPIIGSAFVTLDEYRVATIKALTMRRGYSAEVRGAILAKLSEIGATEAVWVRKNGAVSRYERVPLRGDGRVVYL